MCWVVDVPSLRTNPKDHEDSSDGTSTTQHMAGLWMSHRSVPTPRIMKIVA